MSLLFGWKYRDVSREWSSIRAAQYELPPRLLTDAGPHRSQCTRSPYWVARVSDFFGNGWWADLDLAQGSQNSGFKSTSRSIPAIRPLVMACFIAVWDICMSELAMSFTDGHLSSCHIRMGRLVHLVWVD